MGEGQKNWGVANIVHVVYAWGALFEVVHGGSLTILLVGGIEEKVWGGILGKVLVFTFCFTSILPIGIKHVLQAL